MGKQPSMGQKKSKEAIARAALASRKTSKKKWSKGKEKEKKDLAVFVTPKQLIDIEKEVQKMRLVTPSVVSDRFKVNCSIARRLIKYAAGKNLIRALDSQSK
jgi:small subunit ribosomal protein S25e